MATPGSRAASKRPLNDGDSSAAVPTRKAPRVGASLGGFDEHLAAMQTSLSVIAKMELSDAQINALTAHLYDTSNLLRLSKLG